MTVGRAPTGRQACSLTGRQMNRQVLLMLITIQCLSKSDATRGQKATLWSALRGKKNRRGRKKDKKPATKGEVAVSSCSC